MGTDDRERIAIAPGGTLELFEKLGISGARRDDAVKSAMALSGSHVSDRSVALLIRESADKLEVGSGACVADWRPLSCSHRQTQYSGR